jgi:hypothetical protein
MATFSLTSVTLWVQGLSVAGADHGMTPGGRRGNAERDSTQPQLPIETSTPSHSRAFQQQAGHQL